MRLTVTTARKQKRWTVEQLAERAGVHRATVYRLEAGDIKNPSNTTVSNLEAALGLKRGTLMFCADAV